MEKAARLAFAVSSFEFTKASLYLSSCFENSCGLSISTQTFRYAFSASQYPEHRTPNVERSHLRFGVFHPKNWNAEDRVGTDELLVGPRGERKEGRSVYSRGCRAGCENRLPPGAFPDSVLLPC